MDGHYDLSDYVSATMNRRLPLESDVLRSANRRLPKTERAPAPKSYLVTAIVLIFCAAFLRFSWIDWDDGHHLHPDEHFLTIVASSISVPDEMSDYFRSGRSSLNPRNRGQSFYVYGDFPITLTRVAAESADKVCGALNLLLCERGDGEKRQLTSYQDIVLVGRVLSAIMDMGTLLWLFLLARLLFGRVCGLVALGLGAFCVLNIQLAHFFIVDSFATQFVTASLFFVCRSARYGRPGDFAWAGLAIGAAVACRVNVAPLALLCLPAALISAFRLERLRIRYAVTCLVIAAVSATLAFRVLMPNAFSGWVQFDPRWIDNIVSLMEITSPMYFFPPGAQWANRTPWLFPLKDMAFWGMGLSLAAAGIAGWLVVGYRTLFTARRETGAVSGLVPLIVALSTPTLILWLWTGAYFLWVGGWPNPAMRYFLPIYPPLTIFAAFILERLWRGNAATWVTRSLVVVVAATTVSWAIAFTDIYRGEHPRIEASDWIGERLPSGSLIGVEHWDDALPLGPNPSHATLAFNHYSDDTADKRDRLLHWLDQVDYLVLSSNRVYTSIPRLPLRFPLASEYYRMLFRGELGFSPVAEFHAYPRIGHVEFPDQEGVDALGVVPDPFAEPVTNRVQIRYPPADESFSVYDHPRVLVFEKNAEFDARKLASMLGDIDLDTGLRGLPPAVEAQASSALMLDSARLAATRADGTWSRLFDRDAAVNRHPVLAAITVYALVSVLGWLMWPVAFRFLPGLKDRGLMFSRTLALLSGAAGTWYLTSIGIIEFDRLHIGSWLIFMICLSAVAAWRQRDPLLEFLRSNKRLVLQGELLTLAFYTLALAVRWQNPDLWHPWFGGEKPMDYAFFNAVLKSGHFPPYDPWFSGGYINYFYFGFVMAALPVKLIGVVPEVAYHLTSAIFYALAAVGVYGVTRTLACRTLHPGAAAMLAVCLVLVAGNLGQLQLASEQIFTPESAAGAGVTPADIRSGLSRLFSGDVDFQYPGHHWFWDASRSIPSNPGEPGPITEFPFFTLLYGDLHAHFMVLPLILLGLGVALSWWRRPPLMAGRNRTYSSGLLSLAMGGVLLGAVRMTNAWDFPTYLGLVTLAYVAGTFARDGEDRMRRVAVGLLVFYASLFAFTQPFESAFASGYTNLILWRGSRTTLGSYLVIHGIFLFPILSYLWQERGRHIQLPDTLQNYGPLIYFLFWFAAGILLLIAISAALQSVPILLIAVPLAALATAMLLDPATPRMDRAWVALVLCAAALTVLVEIVSLEGDSGRMNSVFKAYYQVWVLWGICAAVATVRIVSRKPVSVSQWMWRVAGALLIAGGLSYTLLATPARVLQRFSPEPVGGLDGDEYMKTARYSEQGHDFELLWDHDAIHWLQTHVAGTPVIAEGRSVHEYLWGNRISVYTGLPTILGWRNHQLQQRSLLPVDVVDRRARDVDVLYRDPDPETAERIIRQYGVDLIYNGPLEKAYYPESGLAKFRLMAQRGVLDIVYRNPQVVIYRVHRSGAVEETRALLLHSDQ